MTDNQSIRRVGVIGLGKMGLPMARNIAAHGFEVRGFDIRADDAALEAAGIVPATSAAVLASESDLVIIVVGFEKEVDDVLFAPDGVVAGATDGLVVAVASTVPTSFMRALPERARAVGKWLDFVDIPITGAEPGAEKGELLVLAGGEEAVLERCTAAFDAFAREVVHLGGLGAGQVTKMVNNLILWACVSANVEGLKLAETLGVDAEAVRDVLLQSSAENWALRTRADGRPLPWAEKDMMIVLHEADLARISLPLCGTVKEVIKGFKIARGYPMPGVDG